MLVDTGATHPVIPRALALELGIRPVERRRLLLATGEVILRDVGWAGFEYSGRFAAAMSVLGGPRELPILGAIALEGMGLQVDPQEKKLRPAREYLLATA